MSATQNPNISQLQRRKQVGKSHIWEAGGCKCSTFNLNKWPTATYSGQLFKNNDFNGSLSKMPIYATY